MGSPGYTVTRQRHDGFLEGIKGSEIKVLDSQPANFSQEKAQAVMEDYIARFGDKIDGAWSVEGNSGAGALTAVRAAVTEGKIKAGHIKLTDPTCFAADYDGIVRGDYYGSVWQSPVEDARAALKAAYLRRSGRNCQARCTSTRLRSVLTMSHSFSGQRSKRRRVKSGGQDGRLSAAHAPAVGPKRGRSFPEEPIGGKVR